MIVSAVVLFAVSACIIVIAIAIYRGNTNLIHDYHQTRVKDKAAYGRDMAKGLIWIAAGMLLADAALLAGVSEAAFVGILFGGIIIGTIRMCIAQKKHNGGIF